ncbi:hypothetical protein SPSYN_00321 [Sporotomaculum syntrophicum]|uniref:Uncharacterized protein n=1 Tax=Sporotomaculum syntrophicum TaxID=182264 RepID=A0A9D2WU01_9FIRM|nr:hypothetical protein [Sporotomaculum syntrophicum]KAF1086602.1 hypothetical protein SPSYN_00321 [Sporotomaculum syntrophicum]
MQNGFWRGVLAGGILAAVISMLKKPDRKLAAGILDINQIRRKYPRQTSEQVFKEMSRRVSGLIKKK